jgi:4-amino-4-deoxy-L-arabinose transferase-like glycosyltransferase
VLRTEELTGRLRNVIDRNRWFSLALLAGFLLRLLTMIGYPGGLWFAGDSYVYVGAALRPQPNLSKTTGYSLFLRLLLPFHSFTLVTLVQHLMGLAVAVMIYVLARRYGVSKKWATIATLPQLLDGYIIEDEHLIMAETVFTFCLMLATLLLLWTTRTRWWVALIAGLLVGYAIIDRTEGAVMLGVIPLFVLIRAGQTYGWRRLNTWSITILVGVGCLVPVAAYDTWFHHYSGTWSVTGTRSDGFYLWGRVSSFAECSQIHASADVMKVCPTDPVTKRSAPGNYIWHASVLRDPNAYINTIGGSVSTAGNSLLTKFDEAAIESQPLGYVKAVVKGVLMSFEWPRQNYPGAGTVYYYDFHLHYVTSTYNTLPPNNPDHEWIPGGTAYSDWLSYGHQNPGVVVKPVAVLIAGYERIFYTWGPLLFVIFLMGLGGVLTITRRPWRLRWQRRQGSMLPWISAVVLLVIPVATADFDYRYLIPVIPFACLAAGLGFAPVRAKQEPSTPGPAEETQPAQVG